MTSFCQLLCISIGSLEEEKEEDEEDEDEEDEEEEDEEKEKAVLWQFKQ